MISVNELPGSRAQVLVPSCAGPCLARRVGRLGRTGLAPCLCAVVAVLLGYVWVKLATLALQLLALQWAESILIGNVHLLVDQRRGPGIASFAQFPVVLVLNPHVPVAGPPLPQ